ncbi:amidohydrolase family protein [Nocardia sp. NBC_01499]|uniref:amidohydrolase family protein n=1 Tax=Nocardia sp. NBC_01499 TaxID=2903597 RepID=UPI00386852A1
MTATGWIDIHAHFSTPSTDEQRHAAWEAMHKLGFMAPHPHVWTPETALASMDRAGVAMQLLSNVPHTHAALRDANTYGATLVADHPSRFGLLAALPTDDPDAALAELDHADGELSADGWAVSTTYAGVNLSSPSLEPVWAELDRRHATVFVHPDTTTLPQLGLPTPLVEVAFDTARTVVAMMYGGVFHRHPNIRFVLAHCGGALPGLSGRIGLLGTEAWVPGAAGITPDEIRAQLGRLYLDTAASGTDANIAAALTMVPADHIVYGTDSGVPCSTEDTIAANIAALRDSTVLDGAQVDHIGSRAFDLVPSAAHRHGGGDPRTTSPAR